MSPPDQRPHRTTPRGPVAPLAGVALAVVGAALAVAAPRGFLLLVAVPAQVLLAVTWLTLVGVPARLAGATIAVVAGVVADVLLAARDRPGLGAVAGIVGLGVVAAVLGQLGRRERSRVTDVIAAQTSAVLLTVAVAPYLSLAAYPRGDRTVAAALLGVALTLVVGEAAGRFGRPLSEVLALVVGGGVGAALGAVVEGGAGAVVALAAAAVTVVAGLVVDAVAEGRRIARPLGALLPFALTAPVAYVVGRMLLG